MSAAEIEKGIETTFMKIDNCYDGKVFKEEKDLTRFLEREATIPFEEGGFYFKVFALENYSETESVLMFKCHHALADGMSLMGLLTCLQD